ncbi:PQQ-dependent sugar dehydrogenase, partial [Maribacter caenipelagi]|uniref:PQQ-dependent sugar dehydrogenase n=1 Tax=Maribacter caenipelagi TaxID=1447781 RepID=UPI001AAF313B
MKKNYRGIILLVSSFVLLTGFVPLFFGSGLTESKPFNLLSDTNFDPLPTGSQPYGVAFTNLDFNTPLNFNIVPNSNNIVVGQRDGKVFWFDNDENVAQKNLLVDLSSEVGGKVWDGGFLGLSIHPLFGSGVNKNFVYVYYTTQSNDKTLEKPLSFSCGLERFHGNYLILEKFEVDATSMQFVENSRMTLIKRRMFNTTHRGGGMEFGNDGYLYVSTGDQAAYINAQQISENLDGGVLRIDVDMDLSRSHIPLRKLGVEAGESDEFSGLYYTIPNDNPFVDASGSVFEEYYSIGHRNPHRLTKDFQTGIFYIGEVGEDSHEEINVLSSGKNYGWPLYEGFDGPNINCLPSLYNNMPHTRPLVSFPRTDANAIIGGYVYRGSDIPELTGKYICADYGVGSEIWSVDVNNGAYELLGNFAPTNIVSFGQDKDGELYLLKQGENVKLYKMKSKSLIESAPQTLTETGIFVGEVANLDVREGFIPYDLIDSFYSDGAIKSRWMAIPNDGSHNTANEKINFSENDNWDFPVGTVLIKHFDYPIDDRNLSITRKVETRFSIKDAEGKFYFLTYKWNEAQTEAYLVDTSIEEDITITTISGATRQISWHFPSEGECLSCHNPSSGGTLGPRTKNLNKNYDYVELGGSIGNQLVTLSALGILDQTITDVDTPDYITHTSISNVNSSLEDRARSYLDLNCAYCHNPSTDNRANFDLRLDRTLVQTGLLTAGVNESLNMDPNERILYEGDALKSILYHRTASVQPGIMMPPLAKNQVDDAGVALLESWINSLQPSVLPPDSGIYRIVNVATNNTLQVLNGGNSNSVNIVHQEYQEEDWQHFQFDNATVGYYEFKAVHSEKYLDVAGFGPMTGSNVWQYEGNNSDAQLWEILDAGDDSFFIINKRTSKYLTAMADGNVIVAANDGSGRVKWKFETTGVQTNTNAYHYRLNAAGPSVASTDGGPDWAAGATSNGLFTGGGYTVTAGNVGGTNPVLDYGLRDGSIPSWMDAGTYASIFTNERWDPGSAPEMGYRFTVPNGAYTVNIF